MSKVGFIGLGSMGAPMAANLLAAGHTLAIYARRAKAMQPLVALGATACASPREVAAASDVIFTMVTDTEAVAAVALGDDGIVHGARAGAIVIDHSTISPAGARRVAAQLKQHGIDMLDAPVSGGVAGAKAGALAIMVGGDAEVLARCTPLLACLGKIIVHIGDSGAGQVAKACNQLSLIVNQQGVAECMWLAESCGVDPLKVREVLMGGFAASRMLDVQAPKMAARDFEGKIESRLHYKDINIVLELAKELGITLPASALAAEMLAKLQDAGGGKKDSAAVFEMLQARRAD